jgi:hypothetical protein
MSAKNFLIIFFVVNFFIQILCRQVNNATSNELIDVSDNSSGEELNPKYIEGLIRNVLMFKLTKIERRKLLWGFFLRFSYQR